MSKRIDDLGNRIDDLGNEIEQRFDSIEKSLKDFMEFLDKRIEDFKWELRLWFIVLVTWIMILRLLR
jgi:ABC-type proline/glycine betaine transport system permease subunit